MTLVNFRNGNRERHFPAFEGSLAFSPFFSGTLEKFLGDDSVSWMPAVNIKERAEDYKIDLAVPGMTKNEFNVEVEQDLLVVSGERKETNKEENEKMSRREFHYGAFKRSFTLPESADAEKISAVYQDGILSLTIAKKEAAKPQAKRQITIE